jgi:hypothetical protein
MTGVQRIPESLGWEARTGQQILENKLEARGTSESRHSCTFLCEHCSTSMKGLQTTILDKLTHDFMMTGEKGGARWKYNLFQFLHGFRRSNV